LHVDVTDAAFVKRGGELVLRETGPARGDYGAHVHQELDAGAFQLIQHGLRRRLLVADGEELFGACHVGAEYNALWSAAVYRIVAPRQSAGLMRADGARFDAVF